MKLSADEKTELTRRLIQSIQLDDFPTLEVCAAFGIEGQKHYEVIYEAVRSSEITEECLNDCVGDGEKLTSILMKTKFGQILGLKYNPFLN